MKHVWTGTLLLLLASFCAAEKANQNSTPSLINTCLITKNVSELTKFYQRVLQIAPTQVSEQYAEFHTGVGVLALFSAEAQEKYIPRSATAGENRSSILEFEVADVDREFKRPQAIVTTWVKPPTTQPWGTRSIYFRDPDGNLVNFFAWVKKS
jgi:uncharacterized glyoxalase superfamily protein PhnB